MPSLLPARHNQNTTAIAHTFGGWYDAWLHPGQREGSMGQSVCRIFSKPSPWSNQSCSLLWVRTGATLGSGLSVLSLRASCCRSAPFVAIAPCSEEAKPRCWWAADVHKLPHVLRSLEQCAGWRWRCTWKTACAEQSLSWISSELPADSGVGTSGGEGYILNSVY